MISTKENNVSVKLDGEYVPFRDVTVTINETATFPCKPLDIRLTLENGEVIYDDGNRVSLFLNLLTGLSGVKICNT